MPMAMKAAGKGAKVMKSEPKNGKAAKKEAEKSASKKGAAAKKGKKEEKVIDPLQEKLESVQEALRLYSELGLDTTNLLVTGASLCLNVAIEERNSVQHGVIGFIETELKEAAARLNVETKKHEEVISTGDQVSADLESEKKMVEAEISETMDKRDVLEGELEKDTDTHKAAQKAVKEAKKSVTVLEADKGAKMERSAEVSEGIETIFKPLVEEAPSSDKAGKKKVAELKRLLEKVGSGESMISALTSAIMTPKADREGKFEDIVVQNADQTLSSFVSKIASEIEEMEGQRLAAVAVVETAEADLAAAKEQLDASTVRVNDKKTQLSALKSKESGIKVLTGFLALEYVEFYHCFTQHFCENNEFNHYYNELQAKITEHQEKVDGASEAKADAEKTEEDFAKVISSFVELKEKSNAVVESDTYGEAPFEDVQEPVADEEDVQMEVEVEGYHMEAEDQAAEAAPVEEAAPEAPAEAEAADAAPVVEEAAAAEVEIPAAAVAEEPQVEGDHEMAGEAAAPLNAADYYYADDAEYYAANAGAPAPQGF
ncbi:unnamed protein product [Amoebophrya sp. A25]|nr:unnamed protein product [Amoebophrya sp. A25]|eukprot:GSA25T00007197001.1